MAGEIESFNSPFGQTGHNSSPEFHLGSDYHDSAGIQQGAGRAVQDRSRFDHSRLGGNLGGARLCQVALVLDDQEGCRGADGEFFFFGGEGLLLKLALPLSALQRCPRTATAAWWGAAPAASFAPSKPSVFPGAM